MQSITKYFSGNFTPNKFFIAPEYFLYYFYQNDVMKISGGHNYIVYIVTNKNKTVLYTGITNDIDRRLDEHEEASKPFWYKTFAGHYNAYFLLHYERYQYAEDAIAREKEIKGWRRSKKEALINIENPEWRFLNEET